MLDNDVGLEIRVRNDEISELSIQTGRDFTALDDQLTSFRQGMYRAFKFGPSSSDTVGPAVHSLWKEWSTGGDLNRAGPLCVALWLCKRNGPSAAEASRIEGLQYPPAEPQTLIQCEALVKVSGDHHILRHPDTRVRPAFEASPYTSPRPDPACWRHLSPGYSPSH